jgi:hypothetical protein
VGRALGDQERFEFGHVRLRELGAEGREPLGLQVDGGTSGGLGVHDPARWQRRGRLATPTGL